MYYKNITTLYNFTTRIYNLQETNAKSPLSKDKGLNYLGK